MGGTTHTTHNAPKLAARDVLEYERHTSLWGGTGMSQPYRNVELCLPTTTKHLVHVSAGGVGLGIVGNEQRVNEEMK